MIVELLEGMVQAAVATQLDVSWALEAGKAACGARPGLDVQAAIVGPHVLVTVYTMHLGRRRNWAQARVASWDRASDFDDYVRNSMRLIIDQLTVRLDARRT